MNREAKDPFFRQTSPSSPGKTTPSLDLAASRLVKSVNFGPIFEKSVNFGPIFEKNANFGRIFKKSAYFVNGS